MAREPQHQPCLGIGALDGEELAQGLAQLHGIEVGSEGDVEAAPGEFLGDLARVAHRHPKPRPAAPVPVDPDHQRMAGAVEIDRFRHRGGAPGVSETRTSTRSPRVLAAPGVASIEATASAAASNPMNLPGMRNTFIPSTSSIGDNHSSRRARCEDTGGSQIDPSVRCYGRSWRQSPIDANRAGFRIARNLN